MAENVNIQRMAELLSNDLFSVFKWQRTGPTNRDWPCEQQEAHESKTHPTDVVFFYDEPYSSKRSYINCDLKSYASGSITRASVQAALESLAKQVACAEISSTWQSLYIAEHVTYQVHGLLFIYNHDNSYDKKFRPLLDGIKFDKIALPPNGKMYVLGPEDIFWLNNVRIDIQMMRGSGKLPAQDKCNFFYPDLVRHALIRRDNAATLDMLTSPWIILEYVTTKDKGIIIYYRRNGETVQEFMYLLDYLRNYQILAGDQRIIVKHLEGHIDSPSIFSKACTEYIDRISSDPGANIYNRIREISFEKVLNVTTQYNYTEVGMGE